MDQVSKNMLIEVPRETAFDLFVYHFGDWWPQEYTWSGDTLQKIMIHPVKDGLCTEMGPYSFRNDWGRVLDVEENGFIKFTWQIGPDRVPIPDPNKAGVITVRFMQRSGAQTEIIFTHEHFSEYGRGWKQYLQAMDSDKGWELILDRYKEYVIKRSANTSI